MPYDIVISQRTHPGAQRPAQALTQFHRQLDPKTKSDSRTWILPRQVLDTIVSGQETPTSGQGRAAIYSMCGKLKGTSIKNSNFNYGALLLQACKRDNVNSRPLSK